MNAFWAMVQKDLKLFFRDRRAMVMSFAAPILIGSFFAYVFGNAGMDREQGTIKVLLVDQEQGPVAARIAQQLGQEKTLDVVRSTLADAREQVRKGSVPVAVVIPPQFGEQATQAMFSRQGKPRIQVLLDPSHRTEASMVKGILAGAVMQTVSKESFNGPNGRKYIKDALANIDSAKDLTKEEKTRLSGLLKSVDDFNERSGGQSRLGVGLSIPFETVDESLTARANVEYNGYAHSFAGMAIQFMLFMGIDVGIGLLLLRQRGLWRRLRAAPLSKAMLLGSRTVSAALIGMAILFVVFAFARLAFGVQIEGSLAGLIGVGAAFSLMTATYGLVIAALGKTPEAARGLSILTTLVLVMLSGAWVPSFLFPRWLQNLAFILPTRWAVDGMDAMLWRGLPFHDAIFPIAVLLLSSAIFGAFALWRFRWEES